MRPGPTARAAAVLVVFLALFVVVDRLSGQRSSGAAATGGPGRTAPPATTQPAPSSTRPPSGSRPTTTVPPTTTAATSEPAGGSALRSPKGVTVQVLNGAFVPGLARQVADLIGKAGYEVVAANTALGSYAVSRVYYTDGHKADAEAFQKRFPAFEQIFPASQAQAGLSRDIALHVVVGANYREIT